MILLEITLLVLCIGFMVALIYRGYLKSEKEKQQEIEQAIDEAFKARKSKKGKRSE